MESMTRYHRTSNHSDKNGLSIWVRLLGCMHMLPMGTQDIAGQLLALQSAEKRCTGTLHGVRTEVAGVAGRIGKNILLLKTYRT
jgi:hypothetical protein